MSPDPSPLNPSQAVERIREIIVGRHLERLEQRVAQLETSLPSTPSAYSPMLDRHPNNDVPLAALRENVQRMVEAACGETELRLAQYREETQRLAVQIQRVAASKASEPEARAMNQFEHRIGSWLTDWQASVHVHLQERDRRLAAQIRDEAERRKLDQDCLEERFSRIAQAARNLADCLSPTPFHSNSAAR